MRLLSVAHGMLQDCKIIKFSEVETGSFQGVLIVVTNKINTSYISREKPVLLQFINLPDYLAQPPRQICNSRGGSSKLKPRIYFDFSSAGHGLLRLNVRLPLSGTWGILSVWLIKKSGKNRVSSGKIQLLSGRNIKKSGTFRLLDLHFELLQRKLNAGICNKNGCWKLSAVR